MYACMHACMCICMYVCMHVCMAVRCADCLACRYASRAKNIVNEPMVQVGTTVAGCAGPCVRLHARPIPIGV